VTRTGDGASKPTAKRPSGAPSADLTERVVASEVIRRGHYLEFRIDTVERADGTRASRDIVGHPGAVAMVALDEQDRVLLVRQYRVAARKALLEIPAGTLDVDAATGKTEDPDLAAARELEEETGYRAGSWQHLTSFWTAPGFATECMHLYLATELEPAHEDRRGPDEDERLELERMPWRDAVAAVERREIEDSKSIIGLLWLARLRANEGGTTETSEAQPGAGRVVDISFQLTMWDVVAAGMTFARASRGALAVGAFAILTSLLPLINGDLLWALPGILLGFAFVTGVFMVPLTWYQLRKRPELYQQPIELAADEKGLRYDTTFGKGAYRWATFKRVRQMGGFLFLDTGVGANVVVPVKAFDPEALAKFRKLLLAAGLSPNSRRAAPH
jgi:ADP-ribose pyrophosphatase